MSTGYTRQALANIQPALDINAEDINNELNQVQSAFDNTVGHDHTGSAPGTGGKINLGASVSGILPVANGGTGVMASTGTGSAVLNTGPTLSAPVISGGMTISTGGLSVIAGGLTVSAGGVFDGSGARVISNSNKFGAGTVASAGVLTSTSAPGIMMGYAGSIVPNSTGRILFLAQGQISNDTANDGAFVYGYYGTGTAPVNGAGVSGSIVAFTGVTNNANTAALFVPFAVIGLATGLTVGTTYWLDLALQRATGGTASIQNVRINAIEI